VISDLNFKVTTFFEVEYRKVTIAQEETIPNIWNGTGTMFVDVDWPQNASCGFVSISWASCYLDYFRKGKVINYILILF